MNSKLTIDSSILLRELRHLRNFNGTAEDFLQKYLEFLLKLGHGTAGFFCILDPQGEWRILTETAFNNQLKNESMRMIQSYLNQGVGIYPQDKQMVLINNVVVDAPGLKSYFAGIFPLSTKEQAGTLMQSISLMSDLFLDYKLRQSGATADKKIEELTAVLELMQLLEGKKKFKALALALTGELAHRFSADRVSLGMAAKGYIEIQAVSHIDHLAKKMQIVRDLEATMEEALDQNATIYHPNIDSSINARAHEYYAQNQGVNHILTIPIRVNHEVIGCLSLERNQTGFNEYESSVLHLIVELLATKLHDSHIKNRFIVGRCQLAMRKVLSKVFGYEHTWLKLFALMFVALVVFSLLFPLQYRVSAPAMLKTDKIIYITAPFDGFIDSVFVKPGDVVYRGQRILSLERKQLILEEADLLAEEQGFLREIQKAQAATELADMRIAQAQLAQVRAKLKINRHKQEKSNILAMADSAIIIEGDLQKRIGAPVSLGEELFQIALIENIYVEVDVEEQEITHVKISAPGELALKSRPESVYAFTSVRVSPTSRVKEQENVFAVRGDFAEETPPWFRHGMAGIAKVKAVMQTLWWILTHQVVDYLRLKFWW